MPYQSGANSRAGLTATTFRLSGEASIKSGLNPETTAADYSTDQTFTVTAEDGITTKTYTVTVKIQVTDANRFDVVYGGIRRLGNNANLDHLDMSRVTNLENMFSADDVGDHEGPPASILNSIKMFNGDISEWMGGSVVNMQSMFYGSSSFNQDLSDWNTHRVYNCDEFAVGASALRGVKIVLNTLDFYKLFSILCEYAIL